MYAMHTLSRRTGILWSYPCIRTRRIFWPCSPYRLPPRGGSRSIRVLLLYTTRFCAQGEATDAFTHNEPVKTHTHTHKNKQTSKPWINQRTITASHTVKIQCIHACIRIGRTCSLRYTGDTTSTHSGSRPLLHKDTSHSNTSSFYFDSRKMREYWRTWSVQTKDGRHRMHG